MQIIHDFEYCTSSLLGPRPDNIGLASDSPK